MTPPDSPSPDRKHFADGELAVASVGSVPAEVRERVLVALAELDAAHDWWAQPLALAADGDRLAGGANFTLVGYETADGDLTEVEPEDDAFMAWMDLCTAVDFLRAQSDRHGLSFALRFGDEPLGGLAEGQESDELEAFLVAMGEAVGADFDDRDDERAIALDEAYSDRR